MWNNITRTKIMIDLYNSNNNNNHTRLDQHEAIYNTITKYNILHVC